MSEFLIAAILIGLVCLAGVISVELAISAAILEVIGGVIAGNFLNIHPTEWLTFIASSGGIILTFLAGSEINPKMLKEKWRETLVIGGLSTLVPAVLAFLFTYYVAGWSLDAAKIAAIAMSTTSVAVVYTVLIEAGLLNSELGKVLMAATFVTDFGAVTALSLLFTHFDNNTFIFFGFTAVLLLVFPFIMRFFFKRYGNRVIEPEIKLLFFVFFITMFFAELGKMEAVLPIFLLGLLMADYFHKHEEVVKKLRLVGFAFITPFFFIKGGMNVSLGAVVSNLWIIFALLAVKIAGKFIGVYPSLKVMMPKIPFKGRMFFNLIKCTGLTFGTIASLYGLNNGYITQVQFSVLVTVVILSAVVPTIIAQKFFTPRDLAVKAKEELLENAEHALEGA